MSKSASRSRIVLGTLTAIFFALEPLMLLWQPLLPPGSYAIIATLCACARAGLSYYTKAMEKECVQKEDNSSPDDAAISGN